MMTLNMALRRILPASQAPDEIDLIEIRGAVEWLNRRAHLDPVERVEYMSCIVRLGNSIHSPHETRGQAHQVTRLCNQENDHNDHYGYYRNHDDHYRNYRGSLHIHLPDRQGFYGFGFSPGDFAATFDDGDHIGMVVSGKWVYALYRTKETGKLEKMTNTDYYDCWKRWNHLHNTKRVEKAEREFTQEMCAQLKYVLYQGLRRGPLRKIWTP